MLVIVSEDIIYIYIYKFVYGWIHYDRFSKNYLYIANKVDIRSLKRGVEKVLL